jgi:hypothetical protein
MKKESCTALESAGDPELMTLKEVSTNAGACFGCSPDPQTVNLAMDIAAGTVDLSKNILSSWIY